ncbi:S1 family peptidase [Conexibacter sp. JD483]|uniref:S1 family peptidase n=1 Tax=unclassified Conexibacter TaxID=2627773 RepID=UPI002728580A|nr:MULTISPECIES: S1 family peptidase [unclassified Conexibacter]MDO8185803.1 S1 family peptidase [Conexibacter sp. CPCC 205706]MDO8198547.1 S1 family peptidase [Conexibacter sp. CPCC 205762]MDR9367633.1 S1 family peptidase [Conexibacter sp. JD483]
MRGGLLAALVACLMFCASGASAATVAPSFQAPLPGVMPTEPDAATVKQLAEHDRVSVAHAEQVLKVQAKGGNLGTDVKERLGSEFAGVWLDRKEGRWKVGVISDDAGSKIQDLLSQRGIAEETSLVRVDRTDDQLRELAAKWEATHPVKSNDQQWVLIDHENNAVRVKVPNDLDPKALAALRSDAGPGVEIESVPPVQLMTEDDACNIAVKGCDAPARGGVKFGTNSVTCTAGFMTIGTGGRNYFMLTAGHCLENDPIGAQVDLVSIGNVWRYFGVTHNFLHIPGGVDTGIVRYAGANSWWSSVADAVVAWTVDEYRLIWGWYAVSQGEWVCHSGITSGIQCGNVVAPVDATGRVAVAACSKGGDSGGPWIVGYGAAGIHSSSTPGDCVVPETSWYTQIDFASNPMHVVPF